MITLFLVCFFLGLCLSLLAAFAGGGHLHLGHFHIGHGHVGHGGAGHGGHPSALNGFTLPAFLCLFGGIGYLLYQRSSLLTPIVLILATLAGLAGASALYALLFKVLMPSERILTQEDTRMDGVVARVSDGIRGDGAVGEILYSQIGARRSAAARSETGLPIPRGTEVVVLRYERGIAYVSPLHDLAPNLHS